MNCFSLFDHFVGLALKRLTTSLLCFIGYWILLLHSCHLRDKAVFDFQYFLSSCQNVKI